MKKIKANDKCICGSGKKYKKCCYTSGGTLKVSWTNTLKDEFMSKTREMYALSSAFYMINRERLPEVEIRPSPIHGNGVFACEYIDAWDVATIYPAHILCGSIGEQHVYHSSIMDVSRSSRKLIDTYQNNLEPNDDININLPYKLKISADPNNTTCGIGHLINDAGIMNKLTKPQLDKYLHSLYNKVNCISYHVGSYGIVIVATKPIKKDEELLMHYGVPYWFDGDSYKSFLLKNRGTAMKCYNYVTKQRKKCKEALKSLMDRDKERIQYFKKINS